MVSPRPLLVENAGSTVYLTLHRPEARNALNAALIAELTATAALLASSRDVRAVVLRGSGSHFCAGADLQWMRDSMDLSEAENLADARMLAAMFETFASLPQILLVQVQGAAIGGGAGLVAVADFAVAASDAVFAFTEVRLGLLPAVISPFVLAKIGPSHTRARFVTGTRFDASAAAAMGLVHEVVAPAELDARTEQLLNETRACAPQAVAETKMLLRQIMPTPIIQNDVEAQIAHETLSEMTAAAIAKRRRSDEAQAGLRAFLDRAAVPWKSA